MFGKSAGVDNIPGELIAHGGAPTLEALLKISNNIWSTGIWPQQWIHSIVVPIPKKGDLKQCRNYCTICLMSHPTKALLRGRLKRLHPKIESLLVDKQVGFRAGRSTTEEVLQNMS